MYLMLQQKQPDDYIVATGETHTVREFIEKAAHYLGMDLIWKGRGVKEKGIDKNTGKVIIEIDPKYFRPTEVDILLGDSSKAQKKLGWKPKVKFDKLVSVMVEADLKQEQKNN
jgi:GDPmannose 4,6-dehydratase